MKVQFCENLPSDSFIKFASVDRLSDLPVTVVAASLMASVECNLTPLIQFNYSAVTAPLMASVECNLAPLNELNYKSN